MKKVYWQRKLIDKESLLMKTVDWQRNLSDEESWFTKNKWVDDTHCYVIFTTQKTSMNL